MRDERLARRISERAALVERQLRSAYRSARFSTATGNDVAPPPLEAGLHAWLDDLCRSALRRTYPSFERFAPTHGPLPQEAHRRFMAFAYGGYSSSHRSGHGDVRAGIRARKPRRPSTRPAVRPE